MKLIKTYLIAFGAVATMAVSTGNAADQTARQNRIGNVETLNQLLGRPVLTSDNQQAGRLQNILMDLESGRVLYAVIDGGGDLDRNLAVPPGIFRPVRGNVLRLSVDKQQLSGSPEFNQQAGNLGDASFVAQVYRRFGQNTWWEGSRPADQGSFNNVFLGRQLIRTEVLNVENKPMGQVRTAAVDLQAGRVLLVVLNPSGDLKLGNELFALPPNALTRSSSGHELVANITRDKLATAPRFRTGQTWPIDNPQFAARVYQFYGKKPYFQTSLQPTGRDSSQVYQDEQYVPNDRWENQDSDRDYDRDLESSSDRINPQDDRWQEDNNLWYQGRRDY